MECFIQLDFVLSLLASYASRSLRHVRIQIQDVIIDESKEIQSLIRSTTNDSTAQVVFKTLFQSIKVDWVELVQSQSEWDDDEERLKGGWIEFIDDLVCCKLVI